MPIPELVLRLTIAFITLLILTRIMGRKEISQMTFFNFISGIAIGTIGASLAIDSTLSIRNGVIALIGWSAFTLIMGILNIKSKNFRIAVQGQPSIVVKDGKIMEEELRKVRLDVDALNGLLRQKDVFSITDVDYAIFETSGNLSVLKKEQRQPVTQSDMNIQQVNTDVFPITTSIISDGKVDQENMGKLNINKQWINQQLNLAGVNSISDVFYAEIQKDGSLYIDNKSDLQN
ncbi:hypothetical protein CIL05_12025 [Virgibacillus profundi]|uniref:DUF421 domain-containing protein n=1 Tax=Virgibacillus profundi TaxID=2024555 RepID=A0A2A2ICT5_9BACI|nr:DUF421 domain-containing protein [Virgibacillus profundi]PAV29126.1 hypothetical protein CIL05_12025 [Virgibacillus profundi]PXY53294.1 DUF421 domain-containing protein [Virgibacillus profundi]